MMDRPLTGLAKSSYVDYTAKLNWFSPASTIPALANLSTAAETLLGILHVVGWRTRITALLSGVLLAVFAVAMTLGLGANAPLNFSVFAAADGALLHGACTHFPYSLNELLRRNRYKNLRESKNPDSHT